MYRTELRFRRNVLKVRRSCLLFRKYLRNIWIRWNTGRSANPRCQITDLFYLVFSSFAFNCWLINSFTYAITVSFSVYYFAVHKCLLVCHCLLTACEQDQDGTAAPSWSCSQAVSKPVWHKPLLCVQWESPDDGHRNCPKHVEFYCKNKFEKLVHLVGFIIRKNRNFVWKPTYT